jgi:RHS repeat-associated protein
MILETDHKVVGTEDSTSGRIEFSYDNLDRLVQELTPQGTVEYQYDAIGRRTTMTVNGQIPVSYQYDSASRLTQVAQGTQVVGLGYDAAGRRTSLSYPNGVNTTYTYDFASRLTNILHEGPSSIIEDLTYTYDVAGNRISFTRTSGTSTLLPDAVQAAYDAANEQIQFDSTTPNQTYDANGNLTSQTDASGTTTYTWDARNRLVAISGPGVSTSYVYDGLGRRIIRTFSGERTEFIFDVDDIFAEIKNGTIKSTYLRTLSFDEAFIKISPEYDYFHSDSLGSVLALSDDSGSVHTIYNYDPFGKTIILGSNENPFQFTGRENDGNGIYYYRARYFSPILHRFISEDPLGLGGGQINLFAYVGNSPTNFTDSTGLYIESFLDLAFIGYDLLRLAVDGRKGLEVNLAALSADLAGLATPFGTGFGLAVRVANKTQKNIQKIQKQSQVVKKIRNDPNTDALIQLAKEAKKKGRVTPEDAKTLDKWRKEYGLPGHGPQTHPARGNKQGFGSTTEHINVGPVRHIEVRK